MNIELPYRLYSLIHSSAKRILKQRSLPGESFIFSINTSSLGAENGTEIGLWESFIQHSTINGQSDFDGLHYAGYILENGKWVLPSWIWTNAAIVRTVLGLGKKEYAENLGLILAKKQESCGGWIVRYDYDQKGHIPILAPNDSAYIANNAFLSLYTYTGKKEYLAIAEKCAQWIMSTCREDGIVSTGFNMRDGIWEDSAVIVDTGFTAALFANLIEITRNPEYERFLLKFIYRYITLFFNDSFSGFSTSIDKYNHQQGGYFGRGQAWALEGLIPSYKVLRDEKLKTIIERTVDRLVCLQNSDGSWAYNLSRKMMGNDCKGVPVIAKSLVDWFEIHPQPKILNAIKKANNWCCKHTKTIGEGKGGIFSFCTEGAIVRNLYSSCAFVYSSAYAINVSKFLTKIGYENHNSH